MSNKESNVILALTDVSEHLLKDSVLGISLRKKTSVFSSCAVKLCFSFNITLPQSYVFIGTCPWPFSCGLGTDFLKMHSSGYLQL